MHSLANDAVLVLQVCIFGLSIANNKVRLLIDLLVVGVKWLLVIVVKCTGLSVVLKYYLS